MARNGFEMVGYADDFIVLCSSQGQAQAALECSAAREIDPTVPEALLRLGRKVPSYLV
jgi:hypothetical protein